MSELAEIIADLHQARHILEKSGQPIVAKSCARAIELLRETETKGTP